MSMTTLSLGRQALDRLLNPVQEIFTTEFAQALVNLRADAATQELIEDLGHRHHEGQLTAEELVEYEALVNGANLIAVLQAKARSFLRRHPVS